MEMVFSLMEYEIMRPYKIHSLFELVAKLLLVSEEVMLDLIFQYCFELQEAGFRYLLT